MIKSKRGLSTWIWILIVLILVAVGIGIYFLMSGSDGGILSGNSIPQPPALPSG